MRILYFAITLTIFSVECSGRVVSASSVLDAISGYSILAVLTDAATAAKAAPRAEGAAQVNPPVVRQPCMMPGEKRLVLQSPQPTIEDALRDFSKERIEQELQALNLTEYAHAWTIVGPGVTRAQLVRQLNKSSRFSKAHGCIAPSRQTITGTVPARGEGLRLPAQTCKDSPLVNGERKCLDAEPGRAIIETGGLGEGTYNAQSVYLDGPTVGNNQGSCFFPIFSGGSCRNYIAFLNNVTTDTGFFLQAGLVFRGPTIGRNPFGEKGFVVWTDDAHGTEWQPFPFDYTPGHTYWTTITFTSGLWWMCALDTANTPTYTCNNAPLNNGTYLKPDLETSIWTENFNTEIGWDDGSKPFSPQWRAHDAKIYVDGSPRDWQSQQATTMDTCSTPWLPIAAISGSLTQGGSAYFWTDGIPLYCEPPSCPGPGCAR